MKKGLTTRIILTLLFMMLMLGYLLLNKPNNHATQSSRFVKLINIETAISAWAGPWNCVFDKNTGLIWEVKNDEENYRDKNGTFSWYQKQSTSPASALQLNKGQSDLGDCSADLNQCDTHAYIQKINQVTLCGIDQWRLPTDVELNTLIVPYARENEAQIDKSFFPHTKRGDYWTSNSNQNLTGVFSHLGHGAIAIDFIEGQANILPYRNAAFIRLVSDKNINKVDIQ